MDTGPTRLSTHVADKACAIFERHGAAGTPSTRYRDLVDLVAIVLAVPVEAEPQLTALRSEAQRRGLQLAGRFAVPDRGLWQPGYAAEAGRSLLLMARTLDQVIARVASFLEPLLDGTARHVEPGERQVDLLTLRERPSPPPMSAVGGSVPEECVPWPTGPPSFCQEERAAEETGAIW